MTNRRDDGIVVLMASTRVTTDDYLASPETRLPQELVYGLVRDAAAPAPLHQWAVGE
ncbi:MAG: hypothetical protein H0W08_05260, partial [Acidobacteria bacterium]|nr:hypothetical protein [Acidobacteriota bacterium]